MGLLDRFRREKKGIALSDDEKGYLYEQDPQRERRQRPGPRKEVSGSMQRYISNWAPPPNLIRALRFILYALTSASALTTAALCLSVVVYYNTHGPVIKPAWGSLIADIVFGLATPFILFGTMLVTPRLFRPGSFLDIINQTRTELLMLFALAAIWISGALALASDLRGQENCLWDGYWHYPKPSDFQDACDRINWSVALAYTTFGLTALQMVIIWAFALYILLYLDQDVLTERTNSMGTRAHLARERALQQRRVLRAAREAGVSTAGPRRSSRSSSFAAPDADEGSPGPMAGGVFASRSVPSSLGTQQARGVGGPMMGGSAPAVHVTGPNGSTEMVQERSGSSHSNGRDSVVRFEDEQPGPDGHAWIRREGPGVERADEEAMDPFEDQRGGYYGFENEEGLTSGRERELRV
ncbi:MARVEL domain-containing protein [Rhodotorula paludigena]|uniref:MARVEL domain-containing protein n=1 Tax=Rhodotorula paludigena TaxID=86838 RepID=UPI00316B1FE0